MKRRISHLWPTMNRGNIMGLKEKLEAMEYLQIYKLWDLWIHQNCESPNEEQMIQELSDMVFHDPGVEAELLSDVDGVDKLCKIDAENIKLLDFLQTSYNEYQADVLPLVPDLYETNADESADEYEAFDLAKNEFLESLWDVISQHFDDVGKPKMKRFEFTITLAGQGDCADGAWIDAVNSFGDDPGMPDPENTKVSEI